MTTQQGGEGQGKEVTHKPCVKFKVTTLLYLGLGSSPELNCHPMKDEEWIRAFTLSRM